MRYLGSILIILLFVSARSPFESEQHFIFPKFDAELVNLWLSCQQKDESSSQVFINKVYAVWDDIKPQMREQQIPHLDISSVIHDTEILIKEIDHYLNIGDFTAAELYTFHILWQFSDIRKNLFFDLYSLDGLISVYETYEEVHCIVNDEMMGLYEWGEFLLVVDKLRDEIKDYKSTVKAESRGDYALDRNAEQNQKITILKQKVRTFEKSLDSGMRTDFIEPCEAIRPSIMDLFKSYAQRVITS